MDRHIHINIVSEFYILDPLPVQFHHIKVFCCTVVYCSYFAFTRILMLLFWVAISWYFFSFSFQTFPLHCNVPVISFAISVLSFTNYCYYCFICFFPFSHSYYLLAFAELIWQHVSSFLLSSTSKLNFSDAVIRMVSILSCTAPSSSHLQTFWQCSIKFLHVSNPYGKLRSFLSIIFAHSCKPEIPAN